MNPLETGALVALAIAQPIIAGLLWESDPQEIRFGAIAKYCQQCATGTRKIKAFRPASKQLITSEPEAIGNASQ